jgi:hypothetical protein
LTLTATPAAFVELADSIETQVLDVPTAPVPILRFTTMKDSLFLIS